MKRIHTRSFLISLLIITFIIACKKENNSNTSGKLKLVETDYQGCFLTKKTGVSYFVQPSDTFLYFIIHDTLFFSIFKNYDCCSSLKDSVDIKMDEVNIFLADTCTQNCLCYCNCSYIFNYRFDYCFQQNIHFFIYEKEYGDSIFRPWKNTGILVYGID
jgi:hypothetical protein